jgi:hypothetical protein
MRPIIKTFSTTNGDWREFDKKVTPCLGSTDILLQASSSIIERTAAELPDLLKLAEKLDGPGHTVNGTVTLVYSRANPSSEFSKLKSLSMCHEVERKNL